MATSVPDSCSPLPPKAPNRPLFERTVQELSVEIAALEERRRFLLERLKLLKEQLNSCRDERDKIGEERTHVDERLNQINREVDAKRDQVQKLRAGLPYLSEDHIQDQVKNLEYQLRKHNFKPAEEKKIIIEIDRLNRSKKALKEHNLLKQELDHIRRTQGEVRVKRDELFFHRGQIKKREDTLKRDSKEIKDELDSSKAIMEQKKAERAKISHEFWTKDNEHKAYIHERREEQKAKWREMKQKENREKQRELEEIKANAEPFEEELKLIANLITYCLRFEFPNSSSSGSSPLPVPSAAASKSVLAAGTSTNGLLCVPGDSGPNARRGSHESGLRQKSLGGLTPESNGPSTYSTPMGVTPVGTPVDGREPVFVYKKEDSEDSLFPGVSKKTSRKNSRNERRNSKAKVLTHNPEIFSQFGSFGLKPPTSTKDIVCVIDGLKKKQQQFELKAAEEKAARLAKSSDGATTSSKSEVGNTTTPAGTPGVPKSFSERSIPPPSKLDLKNPIVPPSPPSLLVTDESCQGVKKTTAKTTTKVDDPFASAATAIPAAASSFNLDEAFPSLPMPVINNGRSNDLFSPSSIGGISGGKNVGKKLESPLSANLGEEGDVLVSPLTESLKKDLQLAEKKAENTQDL